MSGTCDDIINESDVKWALERQGIILEKSKTQLADNKKLAIHRLLQSIHRLDYQCLNKPLKWKDDSGEHTGYYHSMDLMHFLIKSLDIPSRSKLYQKLSLCKLAVPVLFQNEGQVYMDMSLRHVKTTWINEGHIVEGNVTNAPVALFSMIRCGQTSVDCVSKSMLANDLFNFKRDPILGSCGFFSRYSLSSNGSREVAQGTVEGMWYERTSDDDKFEASFGLLNLRGDALQNMETAATVSSISDVLFMFCGKDMFENGVYKNLVQETNKKLHLNGDRAKKIKKLVVIFPKDAHCVVSENRSQFHDISETVVWQKIGRKPQTLLDSLIKIIQECLRKMSRDTTYTLSNRLRNENKESSTENTDSVQHINNILLKTMDSIKNADENQRSIFRKQLFPLQSKRKDYAKTQREENRSAHMNERRKLQDELIAMRSSRFEMIKDGLPEVMSAFLKELFNDTTVSQKLMIVSNIQYALDDWCSKHLLDKRIQYKKSLRQAALLTEKKTNSTEMHQVIDSKGNNVKDTETENCENLAKLLLDMSVGIESIFREVSEIHDTIKTNDGYLMEEFAKGNRELPEVVATLLMKGVSVELMDGDGFTVPTEWLEEVLKSLEKCFQEAFDMTESPKIFVLTVLGAQSTGKSTLLNTMFGVQFPVSAGRCTKGAFMQLIPISIDKFPYHGLLVVDTEGLGAPEYRQDIRHDNEIATFVLGISDLAIINVSGENPINIENFLQISITALMRMTLVEFHPSVIFVHQHCDPTAKLKNITGRHKFMKLMDDAVSAQAKLFPTKYNFSCFQDIVDISLEDDKNDFIYFPQFYEGTPPMSPPDGNYSKSCSDLTRHILDKMKENFERINNPQTLGDFAEKVKLVWKGVLEENFVLSLRNSAEIQVKYDIDNCQSRWKVEMESSMENILEKLSREVEADFKAKQPTEDLLKIKKEKLRTVLHSTYEKRKQKFKDHIKKQSLHKRIYKDWEQKCINKMDEIRNQIMEDSQRRLSNYFNYEKNGAKWKEELQKSKNDLQENARKSAKELLDRKEKDDEPEFTNKEIEDEFEKFWNSVKANFFSKKETAFKADDVRANFVKEIVEEYGKIPGFKKIIEKFGYHLENEFSIEWIENSHVDFVERDFRKIGEEIFQMKDSEFLKDIENLIASVQWKISKEVINLCDAGGFKKMKFMYNYYTFNCGYSVKQYLAKVEAILIETHNESSQKNTYRLTDAFKVIFVCFAAQIAIPSFEKAQQSFIDYMDISTRLDSERENTKQLFTLLLKKEGNLTIAATQITKILHQRIKDKVVKEIKIDCKDILLRSVTQKIHVHGLVLYDVIAMLDNDINEADVNYIKEYFSHPFNVFKKKILHVFDGCQDIRINDMIRVKFDKAISEIKQSMKSDLQASHERSLIEVMCQNRSIKSLGIGEKDFDGIVMPKFDKSQAFRFAELSAYPPDNERCMIESEISKRMTDENGIVKKLKNLITNFDEVSTNITLAEQDEVKEKVISDVNNHLFKCTKLCPLCCAPCNETHSEGLGQDSTHSSHCHRPQGFATYVGLENREFVTLICNDLIMTDQTFSNKDTKYGWINYSNYKSVNSNYKSWNIEPVKGAESLYWKYITYQVTKNLHRFFPKAKQADVKAWEGISKPDAIKNINSIFHLAGNTIAKNKDGFHIIKPSEDQAK